MKLLKGYYAYLAVSGGLLLSLAAQNNWALQMLAFALVSAGALSVQNASRWYMRASIAADNSNALAECKTVRLDNDRRTVLLDVLDRVCGVLKNSVARGRDVVFLH